MTPATRHQSGLAVHHGPAPLVLSPELSPEPPTGPSGLSAPSTLRHWEELSPAFIGPERQVGCMHLRSLRPKQLISLPRSPASPFQDASSEGPEEDRRTVSHRRLARDTFQWPPC